MNIASRGATMAVDWEQRIDFARLQDRAAGEGACVAAGLRPRRGAPLRPEQHPLRHEHAHRGVGARQERAMLAAPARGRSGSLGLRLGGEAPPALRAVAPRVELAGRRHIDARRDAARDGRARRARRSHHTRELAERGLAGEPLGDRPDRHGRRSTRCSAQGIETADAQPVMLEARAIKTADEIALLDHAAAIVDAVYDEIYRMLRPGVREHEVVARAMQLLFELGSEQVEAINAVSGDRCNPHPHVFSDRLLRPGDQAFFDIIHSFMGYRTCYYRTFNVGGVTPLSDRRVQAVPRVARRRDRARAPRRHDRPDRQRLADRGGARLSRRADLLRPPVRARPRRRPLRGADDLARPLARSPDRDRGGDGVRARDLLRRERRRVRSPHRGGGRRHRRPGIA